MDLNIFGVDETLETQGVWHDIGDGRLCIARGNNPEYTTLLRKLMRPHQILLNTNSDQANELLDKLVTKAMVKILTNWENIKDSGTVIEYSSQACVEMLTKYPDFRELVSNLSQQAEHYRTATLEVTAKN